MAADVASAGTEHKYLKETGAVDVGFRAELDGRENKASADTLVTVTLKILDASFACDKALAMGYRKGPAAYVEREMKRHIKAAFAEAEKQVFYGTGTGGDSAGFSGLGNSTLHDGAADAQVVNAGGTTASTGASAWLVRSNDDGRDVQVITGEGGKLDIGETSEQRIAGATGFYPGLWTAITGWLGLQMGSIYSVVRIANLTEDSGKGLTDALVAKALEKFPATRGPSFIAMNRRSLRQLQSSRTATSPTGAPAPFPADSHNIPIIVTDQLLSTEALLA
jgi:hypothetical protein